MTVYREPQPTGIQWVGARVLAVEVEVDRAAAQAFLPPPLVASDPARASVFCAYYPEGPFGIVYHEAAVLLHATDENGPLVHCCWIMVDDDTALIQGRETTGFPKKIADFVWEERGESVVGTVTRKGVELMSMEGRLGGAEAAPPPVFGRRFVNAMGSITAGMHLVDFTPAETFVECRSAEVDVKLASSAWDPGLGELEPKAIGPGIFAVMDFGGGTTIPTVRPLEDAGWALAKFLPRST